MHFRRTSSVPKGAFSLLAILLIMFVTAGKSVAEPEACLRIGFLPAIGENEQVISGYKRVFSAAGICFEAIVMPVRRSEKMLLAGQLDGEAMRTLYWIKTHSDKVVHVPTPVHTENMVAISLKKHGFTFGSLESFRGHSVLITGGHRWAEAQMASVGVAPVRAGSAARFMELIRAERVDVGFVEKGLVPLIKNTTDLRIDTVMPIAYHVALHKKHAALIPVLEAVIVASQSARKVLKN